MTEPVLHAMRKRPGGAATGHMRHAGLANGDHFHDVIVYYDMLPPKQPPSVEGDVCPMLAGARDTNFLRTGIAYNMAAARAKPAAHCRACA